MTNHRYHYTKLQTALTRVLDELDSNHGGHVSSGPAVPILFKEGKKVGTLKSTGSTKVLLACNN